MAFADLHIHSIYSYDGTASISAILKHIADKTDLKVIAITDHDTTRGVNEAMRLGPRYGIEVVPGCEVSTAEGHLLTLFITNCVPAGLTLVDTVRWVGMLGGICIAAHPEAKAVNSLSYETIRRALAMPDIARILVGVETFNGGLVFPGSNQRTSEFARGLNIARVGNSDSHILHTIGAGVTEFDGNSAMDLRHSLEKHATRPGEGSVLPGSQLIRYYVPRILLRKLGWITWNDNPQMPNRYVRMRWAISQPYPGS